MRALVVAAVLASGCYDGPKPLDSDRDGGVDAPSIDAPPGCWGRDQPPFLVICDFDIPKPVTPMITISSNTIISTTTCTFTRAQKLGGPEICVLAADRIHVTSTAAIVQVRGPLPLMLFARNSIEVEAGARLLVSSLAGTPANADGVCDAPSINGEGVPLNGSGGGAGGSFQGVGGNGGQGGSTNAEYRGGVAGPVTSSPGFVRGGCKGGRGGNANSDGTEGGTSGGAIYLLSKSIRIDGEIDASGGPGEMAIDQEGGAGGGSGGMILIDAEMLSMTMPRIFALGGGGGSGGRELGGGASGSAPTGPLGYGVGGSPGGGAGGLGSNPLSGTKGDMGPGGTMGGEGGGGGGGGGGFIFIRPLPSADPSRINPDPG